MRLVFNLFKILIFLRTLSEKVDGKCEYPECEMGGTHTMCKYPEKLDTKAPRCAGSGASAGLTNEDKKLILENHNKLRQKIAKGEQEGFPKAANMMKLSWNNELEMIAQRFINSCGVDGDHDRCRILKDKTPVGQNSANSIMSEGDKKSASLQKMVEGWYNSHTKLKGSSIIDEYERPDDVKVKDFTQLVWAESNRLGCGYREEAKVEGTQPVAMSCNYATEGNIAGNRVYLKGDPCSNCPRGTQCSEEYPGLCENPKPIQGTTEVNVVNDQTNPSNSVVHFGDFILIAFCLKTVLRIL